MSLFYTFSLYETQLWFSHRALVLTQAQECGTTRYLAGAAIKDDPRARLPDAASEIDALEFPMHKGHE
jgi:hypothetical protein